MFRLTLESISEYIISLAALKTLLEDSDIFGLGMDPFYFDLDEEDAKKEKNKARRLRDSQWWKRKRSKGLCHYCKQQFKATELTMDHLIPIARGGKSSRGNIVPACKACNNKKKYLLPFEWESYLELLDREP